MFHDKCLGVPFKPLLKDIIEKQCGMFEVIWKPPLFDSGGGPVTGFQVQIKAKDENWRNCTMFPTNQSCLFKELMSETKYDIRVQALNEKGSSDWKKGSTKTGFIGKLRPAMGVYPIRSLDRLKFMDCL